MTFKYHCLSAAHDYGDYGPFLFVKRPSDKELFAFLQKECGDEMEGASLDFRDDDDDDFARGVGWKGSNLLLNWTLVAPERIPKQKTCIGYRVKDGTKGYVRASGALGPDVVAVRPNLLSRAAAHRLLADWLDCGYLGKIVKVMR